MQNSSHLGKTSRNARLRIGLAAGVVTAAFAVGAYVSMPKGHDDGPLSVATSEWTGNIETIIPGHYLGIEATHISNAPQYSIYHTQHLPPIDRFSALTSSGSLFVWGDYDIAGLGGSLNFSTTTPTPATPGHHFVEIDDEYFYSLGITDSGQVFAWGDRLGAVGDVERGEEQFPHKVAPEGSAMDEAFIVAVSAGHDGALALDSDGQVFAWDGRIWPDSEVTPHFAAAKGHPMREATVTQVVAAQEFFLALTDEGTIYRWGRDIFGHDAEPTELDVEGTPLEGEKITFVAASHDHAFAVTEAGEVYGWGDNAYGQLGTGTKVDVPHPKQVIPEGTVMDGAPIVEVATSAHHTVALADDGRVFSWGNNKFGQLGDGTTDEAREPVEVTFSSAPTAPITSITVGQYRSLASTENGETFQWGKTWLPRVGLGPQEQNLKATSFTVPLQREVTQVLFGEEEAREITPLPNGDVQVVVPQQRPSTTTVDVAVFFNDETVIEFPDAFTYTWEDRD